MVDILTRVRCALPGQFSSSADSAGRPRRILHFEAKVGEIRQSRSVRRFVKPNLRLQERDRWILQALQKCRFLTTMQLARLFFGGSTSAANKRLRKLLDS